MFWQDLFAGFEDQGWDYRSMLALACNFIGARKLGDDFREFVKDYVADCGGEEDVWGSDNRDRADREGDNDAEV